jgi:hypothetical protein
MLVFGFPAVESNTDYTASSNVSVSGIFLVGHKPKVPPRTVDMLSVIWVEHWPKDLELLRCWRNLGNPFWRAAY